MVQHSDMHTCMHVYVTHAHIHIIAGMHKYTYLHTYKIHVYMHSYINVGIHAYRHMAIFQHIYIHGDSCMTSTDIQTDTHASVYIQSYMHVSHRGVLWDNKVSCSCSGHQFLNDRANYQLNFMCIYWASQLSDLQKMVLQITICFVPNMVYIYMVCTLYNKAKHLVQSFNMHFTRNQINSINSITSNNNEHLPEDPVHSPLTNQCILIEIKLCCVPKNSVFPFILVQGNIWHHYDDVMGFE